MHRPVSNLVSARGVSQSVRAPFRTRPKRPPSRGQGLQGDPGWIVGWQDVPSTCRAIDALAYGSVEDLHGAVVLCDSAPPGARVLRLVAIVRPDRRVDCPRIKVLPFQRVRHVAPLCGGRPSPWKVPGLLARAVVDAKTHVRALFGHTVVVTTSAAVVICHQPRVEATPSLAAEDRSEKLDRIDEMHAAATQTYLSMMFSEYVRLRHPEIVLRHRAEHSRHRQPVGQPDIVKQQRDLLEPVDQHG
mmetsp:Transcript_13395/g.30774  ORF Transcript_13395/g.30774 Transcript_13395/m.30774 type:complete len:245 (+) Transcript_13395:390-1124(+)